VARASTLLTASPSRIAAPAWSKLRRESCPRGFSPDFVATVMGYLLSSRLTIRCAAKTKDAQHAFPRAEAIAVKRSIISAVRSVSDAMAHKGPQTWIIHLQGRALLPGFINPHMHSALVVMNTETSRAGKSQVRCQAKNTSGSPGLSLVLCRSHHTAEAQVIRSGIGFAFTSRANDVP
jgi:hypothetical protein